MPYAVFIAGSLLLALLSWLRPRYAALCGAILLLGATLFAGLRGNSNDYHDYVSMYRAVGASTLPYPARLYVGKDPWFGALILGIRSLGLGVQALFLVSSALALSLKARAFSRVFGSCVTPLFVTICTTYFMDEYTAIRVGIALGCSFIGLVALCERRLAVWAVCSLLAVGFHISALAIVLCELPFLFKFESMVWLAFYGCGGLAALWLMTGVLTFASGIVSRVATYEPGNSVTSHAILVMFFRAAVVSVLAYLVIKDEQDMARQRVWKACYLMVLVGIGVFLIFMERAPGLGFRLEELLSAFGVFIISAAFLWRGRLSWGVALGYCMVLILILATSSLLLPYQLADQPLW